MGDSHKPQSVNQDGYCCAEHALCDVEVPGAGGMFARSEYRRLVLAGGPDWCGNRVGLSGAVIESYGGSDG